MNASVSETLTAVTAPSEPRSQNDVEAQTINMFNDIHARQNDDNPLDSDDEKPQRRISYTRENKLAAINFQAHTFRKQKNGALKQITTWEAAKSLGITPTMLKKWTKNRQSIMTLKKGQRKHTTGHVAQEPRLEELLHKEFEEERKIDCTINLRWFMRTARRIYKELYPGRVTRNGNSQWIYAGFKFSNGWFQGFRRRYGVSVRAPTKRAQ
ncbi:MAG: hypothetical protein FRX48_04543 [Lasallia pustulata]|uniref:HTH CENPB-type domain-containing protein n=1 Tax=Lasallia pustulata TaxID=136370 RepID=A0A5M8PRE0_9LECA|nr:MAG: hypothetical protein FRX48_04543 [Lasallia pustulata]